VAPNGQQTKPALSVICTSSGAPVRTGIKGIERIEIKYEKFTLNVFCLDESMSVSMLAAALVERGDSLIIGLGSPTVEGLSKIALRRKGKIFLWLGWERPAIDLPASLLAWWADPDSLLVEVAGMAGRESGQEGMILLGRSVSGPVLTALRQTGAIVEQISGEDLIPKTNLIRSANSAKPFLVLDCPAGLSIPAGSELFWAAESPSQSHGEARVELFMDWAAALSSALDWLFEQEGVPPGQTLGSSLRLVIREKGVPLE